MLLTITNAALTARGRRILNVCVMLCATGLAAAQAYTPPPPPLTTAPCVPTKKVSCDVPAATPPANPAPDQFAFPGDASAGTKPAPPAADKFPFPGEPAETPAAPPSATDKFPFPGEPPDAPAAPSPAGASGKFPFPDDVGSSSSSSSASGDEGSQPDSEKPALADKGSSGSTRAERRNRPAKPQTPEQRESEDLDVAQYYASTGNFKASYLRAQDAVKTIPDEPMAHFMLAEAAGKLKQKDEAIAEYKLYLKLDPEGEKAKDAKRALAELAPK